MLRLYAALHRKLRDTVLLAQQKSTEEFREQTRRKRNPSDEQAKKSKSAMPTPVAKPRPQEEVNTKNFFAPLRTAEIGVEHALVEDTSSESQQPAAKKAGRAPPIILTSTTNLLALQKRISKIVTGNFEFRNTRSGTRIVTKEMTDISAIRKYLEQNNLSYFTLFPKSKKPIKAVERYLPANTPAQDISEWVVDLDFDIISVKQMSTSRRSKSEGSIPQQLSLFLITLPRTEKSKEIFPERHHAMPQLSAVRPRLGKL
jgi:vacuolar-type H+-ATPase subunit I/STV1